MAAGHAYAEAAVRAKIGAIAQDIADAHHAPVAAASGLDAFFVQAAGDAADSQPFLEVEPVDVTDDDRFFRHELKSMAAADAIAVRRAAEYFALNGLATHGGPHLVADAAFAALRPGL